MESKFQILEFNDDDVLSFEDDTFKIGRFRRAIHQAFNHGIGSAISNNLSGLGVKIQDRVLIPTGKHQDYQRWFTEGINCDLLKLGYPKWKKGKVRIKVSVEFYVEEQDEVEADNSDRSQINQLESPLDDLRRVIDRKNQKTE
jgi:hypothetical protein